MTPTRLRVIRETGAGVMPRFGAVETGPIGLGCLHGEFADEVHVLTDLHAVIQSEAGAPGLPAGALYLTSLRPTAPFIMLNVCMGDEGVVGERPCGCALGEMGWTTHLHTIRSFEKLTGGGMTFLDVDIIRILETLLPQHFGGGPTDYQLIEEETQDGAACLHLLVHPRLGPLDSAAVARVFHMGIDAASDSDRVMNAVWRNARLVRVERQPPRTAASGKVLHLLRGG